MSEVFGNFLSHTPVALVGLVVLVLQIAMMWLGAWLGGRRQRSSKGDQTDVSRDDYWVTGSIGLMALLLGFTFALAIDRYDNRRFLVLQEANAIGTTYLRAQLLDEPWRSQLSALLKDYTENRIALARARTDERKRQLLAETNTHQAKLWTATVAAIRPIRGLQIAPIFVEAMNATIDTGAARVAARRAHVPQRVLVVLLLYMAISAAILGHTRSGRRSFNTTAVQLALVTIAYTLIIDIDRPTEGAFRESQSAMEDLLDMMQSNPSNSFGTIVTSP